MTTHTDRQVGPEVDTRPAKFPEKIVLKGRFVTLEPLAQSHADDLFICTGGPDSAYIWDYMYDGPFSSRTEFDAHIASKAVSTDPTFFAVVDNKTFKAVGTASFMRIDITNRVVEVGHITFSPALQQTSAATETMYLMAREAFEGLGYRRYEWKCNDLNAPSCKAAVRLGFKREGVFRQHLIVKGRNRDTAWFSILDSEWPKVKTGFEKWLDPSNFDEVGKQRGRLEVLREEANIVASLREKDQAGMDVVMRGNTE
ncbi:hypothetical protein FRB96_005908 [Tulasnella sp. 330]|nr:hypothetical protein FRB96_005908 [Tulasnella sp. 330]KAG8882597.1 hypothetical protein FRB98_003573 [Tulasnella sp. 332]KAG8882839.1 hypothetical protein FRB97_007663 [Tulasnella sp. 331]